MNPYSDLKALVVEVRGTESDAMKHVAAVSAKIRDKKDRIEKARAAAATAKGKK
jgi:hypothetical protein